MLDRIRLAMQTGTFEKLSGHVEVDETYIGGKARNMHASKKKGMGMKRGRSGIGKPVVMGLLERHGEFRYEIVPNVGRKVLHGKIRQVVESGANVYTDAMHSYEKLDSDYAHKVIDHAEKYVEGEVHPNGLRTSGACSSGPFTALTSASNPSTFSAIWTSEPSDSTTGN